MNGDEVWHVQENQWEDILTPAARTSGGNSGTGIRNRIFQFRHFSIHFS